MKYKINSLEVITFRESLMQLKQKPNKRTKKIRN